MSDRYSRQTVLKNIGPDGQRKLLKSKVAIVGCGALGSTAASLMVRAGVGEVVLVDRDIVETNNLQRQTLYDESDVGQPKADVASSKLRKVNGEITITGLICDLNPVNIGEVLAGADLVVDATDNVLVRMLINDHCVKNSIPWIYAGVIGTTGMTMNILPGGPCLRCMLPNMPQSGTVDTCDTVGVLNTLPALVASIQVTEALKILTKSEPSKDLVVIEAWGQQYEKVRLKKGKACPCCVKGIYEFLDAMIKDDHVVLCGRNSVQVTPAKKHDVDLGLMAKRLGKLGGVRSNDLMLVFSTDGKELTLFKDGRAIVKGTSEPGVAKAFYAKYVGQ